MHVDLIFFLCIIYIHIQVAVLTRLALLLVSEAHCAHLLVAHLNKYYVME